VSAGWLRASRALGFFEALGPGIGPCFVFFRVVRGPRAMAGGGPSSVQSSWSSSSPPPRVPCETTEPQTPFGARCVAVRSKASFDLATAACKARDGSEVTWHAEYACEKKEEEKEGRGSTCVQHHSSCRRPIDAPAGLNEVPSTGKHHAFKAESAVPGAEGELTQAQSAQWRFRIRDQPGFYRCQPGSEEGPPTAGSTTRQRATAQQQRVRQGQMDGDAGCVDELIRLHVHGRRLVVRPCTRTFNRLVRTLRSFGRDVIR
jgi:hypothetical protein